MTRFKLLFAALAVAAIVGVTPTAHAQENCIAGGAAAGCSVHFVGAGSSAQFLPAGIGGDFLAGVKLSGVVGAPVYATATQCVYHWSAKNAANLVDKRGTVAIPLEPGNIWVVWIADLDAGTNCPSSNTAPISSGNANITDVWTDVSVDSTVGNRAFLAQNTVANGGSGVALQVIPAAPGNLLTPSAGHDLWPDNAADVTVLTGATNLPKTLGTNQSGLSDVHVNAGLTDIRPEDAYFATTRAMGTLSTTRAGLGYKSTTNVGQSILTSEGTGTNATPVLFHLTGTDPITGQSVRGYQTFPIGAAPIVFVMNNGGDGFGAYPTNINSGVLGTGFADGSISTTGWPHLGTYTAANLFDGSGACAMNNAALTGGTDTAALTLFLREPLSGTMNTTEFTLFRTNGNTSDSQEQNVVPGAPDNDNPLSAKPCGCGSSNPDNPTCSGPGVRSRAIGTGEVVGSSTTGVLGTANSLGYIFQGFANLAKFAGASTPTNYNYLTLDGVDPFGFAAPSAHQNFPNCTGPCTVSAFWGTGPSYPTIRDGSYKAWSLYRWLVPNPDADAFGPTVLAQTTENNINGADAVADFIPFTACPNTDPTCSSNAPTDGLDVYREHFTVAGTLTTRNNGAATQESPNGNSLGGATEGGGDVGGLIQGPFGASYTTGHVTVPTGLCVSHKGIELLWKSQDKFTAGTLYEGKTITVGGTAYTVSTGVPATATIVYVSGSSTSTTCSAGPAKNTLGEYYSIQEPSPQAVAPGVLGGKQ